MSGFLAGLRALTLAATTALVSVAPRPSVSYELTVATPATNEYLVTIRVRGLAAPFDVAMVKHQEYDDRSWRFVRDLRASGAAAITRVDSARWRVTGGGSDVVLSYRMALPARDNRAAYQPFVGDRGGLVGDLHSFMYVVGHTALPARVAVHVPAGWEIATQLDATGPPGIFTAPNADALMDAPILVGQLRTWSFRTAGTSYRIAFLSRNTGVPFDTTTLVRRIQAVAQQAGRTFGRLSGSGYVFLLQDGAYGALEHSNSVTLGVESTELASKPSDIMPGIAHEFVHAWNLVRLRPAEYHGIDYRGQSDANELWFGEGVTMYYADVLLRRARVPNADSTRRTHLERLISRYVANPGNARFSPEDVSRVANATVPNPLGDYAPGTHLQGELLGVALDLVIRDATADRRSLDDVMRAMLARFDETHGFTDRDLEQTIARVCACNVTPFFNENVRAAHAIDFNRYLRLAGLEQLTTWAPVREATGAAAPDRRVRAWLPPGDSLPSLVISEPQGAWGAAGLHTGDRLLSMNDSVLTAPMVRRFVGAHALGDTVRVAVLHAGVRRTVSVVMAGYDEPSVQVVDLAGVTAKEREMRERWLRAAP